MPLQSEEPGRELEGYVLDILTHSRDMDQSIQQILEIVGRQAESAGPIYLRTPKTEP